MADNPENYRVQTPARKQIVYGRGKVRFSGKLAIGFVALLAMSPVESQQVSFITTANADLTPQQGVTLSEIQNLPTTQSTRVVRLEPGRLISGRSFMVPISNNRVIEVRETAHASLGLGDFQWEGRALDASGGMTSIVVNGSNVTGTIRASGEVIRIRPLGGRLHALIRVNQSNFPEDHPPSTQDQLTGANTSPEP